MESNGCQLDPFKEIFVEGNINLSKTNSKSNTSNTTSLLERELNKLENTSTDLEENSRIEKQNIKEYSTSELSSQTSKSILKNLTKNKKH